MKRYAEALVECGYAKAYQGELGNYFLDTQDYQFDILIREKCDPFTDTLEGRRQANALEDWLINANSINYDIDGNLLWDKSEYINDDNGQHQWRLERIKWCFEQLENEGCRSE